MRQEVLEESNSLQIDKELLEYKRELEEEAEDELKKFK